MFAPNCGVSRHVFSIYLPSIRAAGPKQVLFEQLIYGARKEALNMGNTRQLLAKVRRPPLKKGAGIVDRQKVIMILHDFQTCAVISSVPVSTDSRLI